ncbi:MAG: glycosyltransferase [Planctomycetota bacterium]|nr:glycosyltransferase [Planctomycetota bacterium]
MKVLLAVHGYPPELCGGTEGSTQALARSAAAGGVEVMVVAGSLEHGEEFSVSEDVDRDPQTGAGVRVRRMHRSDLYFDHWHKLHSEEVGRAFTDILEEWRPDVVHVMHWLRLSDDLVLRAARAGIPSLVTMNDHLTSCLLSLRVHPEQRAPCEETHAAMVCMTCAGAFPPRTPWVPPEQQLVLFGQRKAQLDRELDLAQFRIVPSQAHGEALVRHTGRSQSALVIPPARAERLRPSPPLPAPDGDQPLRLGLWSGGGAAKGARSILSALMRVVGAGLARPVELHLAGIEPMDTAAVDLPKGLTCIQHGPFKHDELSQHPVARVHAALVGSLAPESYGLVADEAFELGLPTLLPSAPALVERFQDQAGVEFYDQASEESLAEALGSLCARLPLALPTRGDIAPGRQAITAMHMDLWERVCGVPAPEGVPAESWFEARIRSEAQASWDRQCSQVSAEDLGFSAS